MADKMREELITPDLRPFGRWQETAWVQPVNHANWVKQFLWWAKVTSTVTGAVIPVQYYAMATADSEEDRPFQESIAITWLMELVRETLEGRASLVAQDRLSCITVEVQDRIEQWMEDGDRPWPWPDDWRSQIVEAVEKGNAAYEAAWANALALGADTKWRIPVVPWQA